MKVYLFSLSLFTTVSGFAPLSLFNSPKISSPLFMAEDEKAAPLVSGEELEMMLTEWEQPLVVDAYATWYVM